MKSGYALRAYNVGQGPNKGYFPFLKARESYYQPSLASRVEVGPRIDGRSMGFAPILDY
jgi:hypothetical protein